MKAKEGDRVGAILSADKEVVKFLGYGKYLGNVIPTKEEGVTMMGMDMHEICTERNFGNPCIELENGKRVYGCECWWGTEAKVIEILKGRRVEIVNIEDARRPLEACA